MSRFGIKIRILGEQDKEYVPQNDVEKKICDLIKLKTGKDIVALWSRATFPFEDIEGNQIDPGYDYVADVSELHNGKYYISGIRLGININDEIDIVEVSHWT